MTNPANQSLTNKIPTNNSLPNDQQNSSDDNTDNSSVNTVIEKRPTTLINRRSLLKTLGLGGIALVGMNSLSALASFRTNQKEIPVQWFTKIYAPRHYGVYLISGECFWYYKEQAEQGLGFSTDAGGGWRSTGVMTSGGSPNTPVKLPLGVRVTWLSTTEKKYYQANIELPREIMLAEFGKKFDFEYSTDKSKRTFTDIQLALAPTGFISLRLGGTRTLEIATYQAKEIDISWDMFAMANHFKADSYPEDEFMQDQYNKLPAHIKTLVNKNNLPTHRWQDYSNTFNWGLTTNLELAGCRICCVNGNSRFYNKADIEQMGMIQQTHAPAWIGLFYKQDGKRYKADIRFTEQRMGASEQPTDDVAIYQVFKQFFASCVTPCQATTTLAVELDNNEFIAYLTNGTKKQKLAINQIKITPLNDDDFWWFI